MYKVYYSLGNFMRKFPTYRQASLMTHVNINSLNNYYYEKI